MNNVTFTRVKIFRNIKDFKFMRKLEQEKRDEIIKLVSTALKDKLAFMDNNSDISQLIKYRLVENNSYVFKSKNGDVCVNLFAGEHITIISSDFGFNLKVFDKANDLANSLSNKISLQFNDEYGYLMSDLALIGAGLKLECDLSLNSLKTIGKIEQVKQNLSKLGYNLVETEIPHIYTISTTCNLGLTEKEILKDFEKTVIKLNELEVESLKMQDVNKHEEILDKIFRSIAVLGSANLLSCDELNNLLVALRDGLNLGVFKLKDKDLNTLQMMAKSNSAFMSQNEAKTLAKQVREIIKGGENV